MNYAVEPCCNAFSTSQLILEPPSKSRRFLRSAIHPASCQLHVQISLGLDTSPVMAGSQAYFTVSGSIIFVKLGKTNEIIKAINYPG
jgi:hypothetical protein